MKKQSKRIFAVILIMCITFAIVSMTACSGGDHLCLDIDWDCLCDECGKEYKHKDILPKDNKCDRCGKSLEQTGSGNGSGDDPDNNPPDEKTIVFYTTQGKTLQSVTENAMQSFTSKYPDWKVQHVTFGNHIDLDQKISHDLPNGNLPDFAYSYPEYIAKYQQSQKILDLTPLINSSERVGEAVVGFSSEQLADFVPAFYEEGKAIKYEDYFEYGYADNATYALPLAKSTPVLYYNKSVLDDCGLQPATTWDELWAQEQVIRTKYPNAILLGVDDETSWFANVSKQNFWGFTSMAPTDKYPFNDSAQAQWLDFLAQKYTSGLLLTQQLNADGYISTQFQDGFANKQNNSVVYGVSSSASATHFMSNNFDVGVSAIPGRTLTSGERVRYTSFQGPSLVMFNNDNSHAITEKQKMTFLFMKELLSAQYQIEFSLCSGMSPVLQSVYQNSEYTDALQTSNLRWSVTQIIKWLNDENYLFYNSVLLNYDDLRAQIGLAMKQAISGEKTGAQALADAHAYLVG